jgi:polyhydroxyalkanoate synthase
VPAPEHEDLAASAAHHAGGAEGVLWHGHGPFTGFGFRQAAGILRVAGRQAVRQPQTLLRGASGVGRELLRAGLGKSQIAPAKGDKRFADPAWRENPVYRAVMQTYLYLGSGVDGVVDDLGVKGVNAERARFALTLVREALAPTNFLLGNPAALKRAKDTRGGSIRSGIANWAGDVRHNRGM